MRSTTLILALVIVIVAVSTVRCDDLPFKNVVGDVCYDKIVSFEAVPNYNTTSGNVKQGGCTEPNMNLTSCPRNQTIFTCAPCVATYENAAALEALVATAGGQVCYPDMIFRVSGTLERENVTVVVTMEKLFLFSVGNSTYCNTTEIANIWAVYAPPAFKGLVATLANSTDPTFSSVSVTLSGCGGSSTTYQSIPNNSGNTTPSPSSSSSSTGGNGNTNTTATTAPPSSNATNAPTGPPNNPTQPPKNGAARVLQASTAIIALMIATLLA